MVRDGADAAIIRARLAHGERRVLLEVQLNRQGSNKARVNGAPVKPAELPRYAQVVLFAPEDLQIVRGDPSARRRFADQLLVQRTPRLAGVLADYDRVLKQRTALLKSAKARGIRGDALSTLDVWDDKLVALGTEVIEARLALAAELAAPLADAYAAIAGADHRARARVGALGAAAAIPKRAPDAAGRRMPLPRRIADLFRAGARRAPHRRARPRSHARRSAPRRPRAAGARPSGEGLRLARRVLVGRARAAARLGRAAARRVPARRSGADPRRRLRRARRRSPRAARRARRRLRAGHRHRRGRGGCARGAARPHRAGRGRARSWRRRMPDPGAHPERGIPMPRPTRGSPRRSRPTCGCAGSSRRRGRSASAGDATRTTRTRPSPPDATRAGSATCSRTSPARPGGTRSSPARTSCGRGRRSPARTPRAHTRPVAFSEGTLTVQADSTAWAKQLQLMRAHILSEIVRRFPDAGVEVIRFIGPDVPSWKWGPRTIPGRGPRDTYG